MQAEFKVTLTHPKTSAQLPGSIMIKSSSSFMANLNNSLSKQLGNQGFVETTKLNEVQTHQGSSEIFSHSHDTKGKKVQGWSSQYVIATQSLIFVACFQENLATWLMYSILFCGVVVVVLVVSANTKEI